MKQTIYSVGGPFPFDRSFRGQSVVEGDWINAAKKEGFSSKIFSIYHSKRSTLDEEIEPQQRKIAEMAFGSEFVPRYKSHFSKAVRGKAWGEFFGLEDVEQSIAAGERVHYVMHYYNSRFQDGQGVAAAAGDRFNGQPFSGYYVLHVNPDQLYNRGDYNEWKTSEDARTTAGRLADIVSSAFFKRIIAVSESTKQMWTELLRDFRLFEASDKAEEKIRVVPNGVDTDLYSTVDKTSKSEAIAELGFSPSVDKVVLVMTRPSASKGADRVIETMKAFEAASGPDIDRVGFLVALPDSDGSTEFLAEMRSFEKLLIKDRLKITIDVSKIVRDRGDLIESMNKILTVYPPSACSAPGFVQPRAYPLTYASDVLLHLPRAEAYGLVVAEALASDCAVVTTRVGGIPSVVANRPEQGLMVSGDDPVETMKAILRASKAPEGSVAASASLSVFDRILKVIEE
jgi:glycosyltransferase involved in cell wall biosynthesis